MESTDQAMTPDFVRRLAAHAGLPLAAGREDAVAPLLAVWIPDANALSAKMSEACHQSVVPATVFVHPDAQDAEA